MPARYTLSDPQSPQPEISLPQPSATLPARPRCLLLQVRLDRGQGHADVATLLDRLEPSIPDGAIHRKDMPHAQGGGSFGDVEPIVRANMALVDLPAPAPFNAAPRPRPRGIVPVERDPRPPGGWPTCLASRHGRYVYTRISHSQGAKGLDLCPSFHVASTPAA